MKKITVLLCALLIAVTLVGCQKGNNTDSSSESIGSNENVDGAWNINTDFNTVSIPEDAKNAFDKAMEGYAGTGYNPVAYLGSQSVSGTNYAFLCTATTVTEEPVVTLSTVIIYNDLDNNAEITDTAEVKVSPKENGSLEFDFDETTGGFYVADAVGGGLSDGVQKAFSIATEELDGVGYEPLALLADQIVSGQNYAILCKATSVTAEPKSALAVVYMHVGFDGNATVSSVESFEF